MSVEDPTGTVDEYAKQIAKAIHDYPGEDGAYMAQELLKEFASKVWRWGREQLADEIARKVRARDL